MKERPIIFNAHMVRAVLDGRKTQTRRIMKVQPHAGVRDSVFVNSGFEDGHGKELVCPFGAVGDRLWVRETWQVARETSDAETGSEYDVFPWDCELFGDPREHLNGSARFGIKSGLFYAANGEDSNPGVFYDCIGLNGKVLSKKEIPWCPSIHMPRWASRITLEITGVRVEQLHAITLGDICKEIGCGLYDFKPATYGFQVWEELWQSIYGEESWQANPWVWVIEFKRVEGEA